MEFKYIKNESTRKDRLLDSATAVLFALCSDPVTGKWTAGLIGFLTQRYVGQKYGGMNPEFASDLNRMHKQANEEFARMYESRPKISED